MSIHSITIDENQLRKLLLSESADAAFLYLYMAAGNPMEQAQTDLHLSTSQLSCATALLRQLGLYNETKTTFVPGERPAYSETDVTLAMNTDSDFKAIYGEVERLLGKTLSTEELKILLGFNRYLGLPGEVVSVLVSWCKERNRQRGSLRNPSLRSIEKEAYYWAEQGIDTLEEAAAFIRTRNLKQSRTEKLKELPPLTVYETAYSPEEEALKNSAGVRETHIRKENGKYFVEGEWLYNFMGQINFSDYESLSFFQRVLAKNGVFDMLREAGIEEGDTVNIYDFEFEFV